MSNHTAVLNQPHARPGTAAALRPEADARRPQTDLVSAEYSQLLLPKLTDEHVATLMMYGTVERTSTGQVLSAAGDLTYDLMVILEGEVEAFDVQGGTRRTIVTLRPRDFIAELNLLTGQWVYVTSVV